MSSKERSSIENGIWLCARCAKLIDSDTKKYTIGLLKSWKQKAEDNASKNIHENNNLNNNSNLEIPLNLRNKLVASVRNLRETAIHFNSINRYIFAQYLQEDINQYNRCIDARNSYIFICSTINNYGIQIRYVCNIDSIIESKPDFYNTKDGNESIQIISTISSFCDFLRKLILAFLHLIVTVL